MTQVIAWIAEFVGIVLKHALPTILTEWKKPKEVIQAGYSDELQADFNRQIEEQAQRSAKHDQPENI